MQFSKMFCKLILSHVCELHNHYSRCHENILLTHIYSFTTQVLAQTWEISDWSWLPIQIFLYLYLYSTFLFHNALEVLIYLYVWSNTFLNKGICVTQLNSYYIVCSPNKSLLNGYMYEWVDKCLFVCYSNIINIPCYISFRCTISDAAILYMTQFWLHVLDSSLENPSDVLACGTRLLVGDDIIARLIV